MLTILRLVESHGGLVSSSEVRARMGEEYDGPSGGRKWRRDLDVLKERGLLESDLTTPTTPRRTGIRRVEVRAKPADLHLTSDEHAAIVRARKVLRDGLSAAAPLDRPEGEREAAIDTATRVLRFVEEQGDEVEVAQLADWLGWTISAVCQLMETLMTDVAVLDAPLVMSLQPGYDDLEDEEGDDADDVRFRGVYILRSGDAESSARPLRGRGMDELGFFPYSLAETDDRLTLIGEALGCDGLDDDTKLHLRWASGKLEHWRRILVDGSMS
jgi:hypothetical protein